MPEKIGNILLPDELKDQFEMAMQAARIVAVSPLAFNYATWEGCEDQKPKVGDLIWIAKYSGFLFDGADAHQYRIIKDKDVGAKIPEPDPVDPSELWHMKLLYPKKNEDAGEALGRLQQSAG